MAPNKRGGPLSAEWHPDNRLGGDRSVVGDDAVAARGTGTRDLGDTYNPSRFWASETRTFFTGRIPFAIFLDLKDKCNLTWDMTMWQPEGPEPGI